MAKTFVIFLNLCYLLFDSLLLLLSWE